MTIPAPLIPSQFEDVNTPLRGLDDFGFKFRVEGISAIDMGAAADIPADYRLEITPDLGWSNTGELFGDGNSRLTAHVGSAVDMSGQDDSILFTLETGEWWSTIRPRFERYLWRVAGVNGVTGEYSSIQTFRLISDVPDNSWSLFDPDEPVGWTQILEGEVNNTIEAVEVLGYDPAFDRDGDQFRMELPLQAGDELLYLRARNVKGETSTYRTVNVDLQTTTNRNHSIWNTFDEHGLFLATPRLPDESNVNYRIRLSDVMTHRGSPRYEGLRNALTRDLGLLDSQYDSAMVVRRSLFLDASRQPSQALYMTIGPRKLSLWGELFTHHQEEHTVNPNTWSITLDDTIEHATPEVEVNGRDIPRGDFVIDGRTLRFRDTKYHGRKVRVSYRYRHIVDLNDSTMGELKDTLEAIQVEGKTLLEIELSSGVDSLPAVGLDHKVQSPIANLQTANLVGDLVTGVPLRWSPVHLYALQEQEFLDSYENEFGNLFQTKVDGWAQQLQSRFQMDWEHVVADQGIWASKDDFKNHSGLPSTMDLPKVFWVSTGTGTRYTTRQYAAIGGLCPVDGSKLIREGVPVSFFKSGVAPGSDLMVRMSPEESIEESSADELISIVQDILPLVEGPDPFEPPEVL